MGTRDRTTAVSAQARYPYRDAPAKARCRRYTPQAGGARSASRRAAPAAPPAPGRTLELRPHAQVELTPVLVERARLGRIERVVLERRIVQVLSVEVHTQVLVVRVGH